jgi:hypothetical protein
MPSRLVPAKFKSGTLHSGSKHGPLVTNRKQMVAIMLSEKRNEDEHGGSYRAGDDQPSPVKRSKPTRRKA